MSGISIPGVSNKYNTNETVEKLMQIERIPLTREQKTLETYKTQQQAWRDVNTKVSTLRDTVKSLYSFDNPFNNKTASSSDESAVTATVTRNAAYESFKIDVVEIAHADKFLTDELSADIKVPAGQYIYKIADKTVSMRWKGGSLQAFSDALSRRGNSVLKSQVIGVSKGKKVLVIESLKTGAENKLLFEDAAEEFAYSSGMIVNSPPEPVQFGATKEELSAVSGGAMQEQAGMPQLSMQGVTVSDGLIKVPPRNAFSLKIPDALKEKENSRLQFSITKTNADDITAAANSRFSKPVLPDSGAAHYKDVTVFNAPVDAALSSNSEPEPLQAINDSAVLYAVMDDGSEMPIGTDFQSAGGKADIDVPLKDESGRSITAIAIRNRNTGAALELTIPGAVAPSEGADFKPQHPVTTAGDAVIKYEGITIRRPTNEIGDIVPEVTLNLHGKTEKTATITVNPDAEAAKDALITFVGKYNQVVSRINILTQNTQELVDELDYLSDDEKKEERARLGMFMSDSSLTTLKSAMQAATVARYPIAEEAQVTMLAQIGISTNPTNYTGYTPGKLRGYLEIDEKKLDEHIEKHLDDIKKLFGYDSDGDLVIDAGVGVQMDRQLTAYVQAGGIFSIKTSGLDGKIKAKEKAISRLETQMQKKEAELRSKYGQMEGALNSLESQQDTIKNFSNRNNGNR